jgi:hypothetical protein
MVFLRRTSEHSNMETCICCGRRITLLGGHQSLQLFLGQSAVQRRGLQCMNCGHVTCHNCSNHHGNCVCGSNAWVALPYLKRAAAENYAY